jgi:hypothetical protein
MNCKQRQIQANKAYIEEIDRMRAGVIGTSGISGGPFCSCCNPYLSKISVEERMKLEQMMRDEHCIDEFVNELKAKYKA